MKMLLLSLVTLLTMPLFAERFDIIGNIGEVRYHEAETSLAGAAWRKQVWFTLVNANKSPDCRVWKGGYGVSIPSDNDTAMSMLLAAKTSGMKVEITIDDSVKYPGGTWCKLQYITLK